MHRRLILACAALVAACATEHPEGASWLGGVALSCHADAARVCTGSGCAPGPDAEVWNAPISLSVPAINMTGRFCLATGCENAQIEPTRSPAPGYNARVSTDDRTQMRSDLTIAEDLSTFTLRWTDEGQTRVWSGVCSPAGS